MLPHCIQRCGVVNTVPIHSKSSPSKVVPHTLQRNFICPLIIFLLQFNFAKIQQKNQITTLCTHLSQICRTKWFVTILNSLPQKSISEHGLKNLLPYLLSHSNCRFDSSATANQPKASNQSGTNKKTIQQINRAASTLSICS